MLDYKDYVYAAYIHRNFSKAAREVHVSQPWFSSAIKKTEQEIQLLLFDRSTNPISLTEAGKYYVEQVERIYAIEDEMRQYFDRIRSGVHDKLRIGSSMFFCTYVLPDMMDEFCEMYPSVKLSFTEGNTKRLTEKLLRGELDIIFEVEPVDHRKIVTKTWGTEEIVLAVPSWYEINEELKEYRYSFEEFVNRDHDEYDRPCVPLGKFRNESFLLLSEENDLHSRSLRICRNAGFVPDVKFHLDQLMTAYYLVCEGQGVTFIRSAIPDHVVATENVVFYRLGDSLAKREVYCSYIDKDMTDIQKRLIEYLDNEASYIYV